MEGALCMSGEVELDIFNVPSNPNDPMVISVGRREVVILESQCH